MSSRALNNRPAMRARSWLATLAGCALLGPAAANAQNPAASPSAPAAEAAAAPAPAAPRPARQYPSRAVADFDRAIGLVRAGNATEAELEFGQLAVAYPDFAGPQINIGLIRRKAGNLEAAEQALRLATERNPRSAMAWSELGVTLRMQGKFKEALAAYESAIAADDLYAPAHRNAAVLLDLYLDDPVRALTEMERYKALMPDDKQAAGWLAELKNRVNRAARASAPPADGAEGGAAAAPPPDGTGESP
jgi:tetratricopeptide (TPR) repeat protein